MIVYTSTAREAWAPDLRQAQQAFDAVVMALLRRRLGHPPQPSTAQVAMAPQLAHICSAATAAFAAHPSDLGLVFAELVDFADHYGFATRVLDEDYEAWTTDHNPRTG